MASPAFLSCSCRGFLPAFVTAVLLLTCNLTHAQTQSTGTTGNTGTGTDSTQFQGTEVDMSAFSGVERGDSVGAATTRGFGIAAETTSTTGGGATAGRGGGGGGFGGLGGLFGALGSAFGGQGTASQKPAIRVRLRSAVEVLPRQPEEIQLSARRALDVTPATRGIRGVNVTMNGRTAILSGTVTSEKDRRMSELLMRLEPGVSAIENRVVVGN